MWSGSGASGAPTPFGVTKHTGSVEVIAPLVGPLSNRSVARTSGPHSLASTSPADLNAPAEASRKASASGPSHGLGTGGGKVSHPSTVCPTLDPGPVSEG